MQKKLFVSYVIIIFTAVAITIAAFWSNGYNYINRQSEVHYLTQAKLIGDAFTQIDSSKEAYVQFVKDYSAKYQVRITLINVNGEVTADSANEILENHATREEVVQALAGNAVTISRYSRTMKQQYSYSAVPVTNGDYTGVIRVSLPLSKLQALDNNLLLSMEIAIGICLLIALFIAYILTRSLARPLDEVTKAAEQISKGDYSIKMYTKEKGSVAKLAKSFNIMTTNLNSTMKKLERRKIQLEAMLSSMSSGVVAINDVNSILFHNAAFEEVVETTTPILKGKSLYNVVRNAVIYEAIDAVRTSNHNEIREGHFISAQKTYYGDKTIRVMATPLSVSKEETLGVLLIIEDVTQIKKLESMRSDFVANVTHELKTPLTSIRGFIDTLKNGAIQDEKVANKFLDIIDIEAERLYSLIQDILILAEIESKKDNELTTVDVDVCIQDVIELLSPKLKDEVEIVYDSAENVKPYFCNLDRIKQLMINLLDNAIKYTEKGTIKVECFEEDKQLVIRVSDTGIGMDEEHIDRVFERFYRVDKGRSRKQGGTGLGLSIVKHIVELYNGTIQLASKLDEGSCFEIRLPY